MKYEVRQLPPDLHDEAGARAEVMDEPEADAGIGRRKAGGDVSVLNVFVLIRNWRPSPLTTMFRLVPPDGRLGARSMKVSCGATGCLRS
jgi:hypothetical protein